MSRRVSATPGSHGVPNPEPSSQEPVSGHNSQAAPGPSTPAPVPSRQSGSETRTGRSRASQNGRQSRAPSKLTRYTNSPMTGVSRASIASVHSAQNDDVLPRDTYQPPEDDRLKLMMATLQDYIHGHELHEGFMEACKKLLRQTDLPYNPYPPLAKLFRIKSERFHMYSSSLAEVMSTIDRPHVENAFMQVVNPVGCDFVWGLPSVVTSVDPNTLWQYQHLVINAPLPMDLLQCPHGYKIQIIPALIGTAVFHGTFYTKPYKLNVCLEHVIEGPEINEAVEIFSRNVIRDILCTDKEGRHIILSLKLFTVSPDNTEEFVEECWSLEQILQFEEECWSKLNQAVAASQPVVVDCMYKLDVDSDIYHRGEKHFRLNFLHVDTNETSPETLICFSHLDMLTLHEGVFFKNSHAEAYLSVFDHQSSTVTQNSPSPNNVPPNSALSNSPSSGSGPVPSTPIRRPYNESLNIRIAPAKKPSPVRAGGFKGNRKTNLAESWQVTAPIKSAWQHKIASLNEKTRLMEIVHLVLLLSLLDRNEGGMDLLVDVYRVLRGTSSNLYSLMQDNKYIEEFVRALAIQDSSLGGVAVTKMFDQYQQRVNSLLCSDLIDRSSDLQAAGTHLCYMLNEITGSVTSGHSNVPVSRVTIDRLRAVNHYCMTVLIQLYEDTLPNCPNLQDAVTALKEAFPEQSPPNENYHVMNPKKEQFKFGCEDIKIMRHDNSVVNVEVCKERVTSPPDIGLESILAKYIIDCHLDDVWSTFLIDLTTSGHLPPNPFPRLVTTLRMSASRMDLFSESSDKVLSRVFHKNSREEDAENFIHHIPGCEAHGHPSALSLVDASAFFHLTPLARKLVNKRHPLAKRNFKIAFCTAVTNMTPWYGQMSPYLLSVDMTEYCYIKGPQGGAAGALELYVDMVMTHLYELHTSNEFPIMGVYLGLLEERWSLDDIQKNSSVFKLNFQRYCIAKEPVYMKAFMLVDWQCTPFIKHFCLNYSTSEYNQCTLFYPENPSSLYLNVFFEKEKAAFHFQNGGPPEQSNPYSGPNIRTALRHVDSLLMTLTQKGDWINVHRWLTVKSLIKQGDGHVVDTWRMLHSVACRIEYTHALGQTLLDLVTYALENKVERPKTAPQPGQTPQPNPSPQPGPSTQPDPSPQPGTSTQPDPPTDGATDDGSTTQTDGDQKFALDLTAVDRMAVAYQQKVIEVVKSQIIMAPSSMQDLLKSKIQGMFLVEPSSGAVIFNISPATLTILVEIQNVLKPLQTAASYDVHCTCPEAEVVLTSIQSEQRAFNERTITEYEPEPMIMKPPSLH